MTVELTHVELPDFGTPGEEPQLDASIYSARIDRALSSDSTIEIRSGMALQVDVIPATGTRYFTTNIEDGIAIADESLRESLANRFPDTYQRIESRRRFMEEALGIPLRPEVLPFSNIPAYLPPFLLSPSRAMVNV